MIFYNITISLAGLAMRLAARFVPKARLWRDGRVGLIRRVAGAVGAQDRVVWVHAASLGEFEQGRPVIEAIRAAHPEYKILLTFFSPSGYEIRKNYPGADWVFYMPEDTPRLAREFVRAAHPEIAIFIKYEFWLNHLRELRHAGARTFNISAIFRRDSVFFKWYGGSFRTALRGFERLFVQDEASRELLAELGVTSVTVAGDTRFDRVASIASAAKKIEVVERFAGGAPVFVAGSTWQPDEELLAKTIASHPEIRWIVVPHEIDADHIDRLAATMPLPTVRYTMCTPTTDLTTPGVLIIDVIGLLSSLYGYATYAYIGGGFGAGIHNTLEAAVFGLPVAFGPNYRKFREAREMIALGAARSISSAPELEAWLAELAADPALYAVTSRAAADYVASNRGATDTIVTRIFH